MLAVAPAARAATTPVTAPVYDGKGHLVQTPFAPSSNAAHRTKALVLALVLGFIARPGEPRDTIHLQLLGGWGLALLASIVIIVGAIMRTTETETVRKPPGVL